MSILITVKNLHISLITSYQNDLEIMAAIDENSDGIHSVSFVKIHRRKIRNWLYCRCHIAILAAQHELFAVAYKLYYLQIHIIM